VHCVIVGADRRPVPVGDVGELVIGGAQLSLGYLGDPVLTARAFRDLNGQRCYWTGDLVRVTDGTGTLEFIGRVDDQIKINGNRIEPEDVLHHARRLPGVREAAVTLVDTPTGYKLLASIVPLDAAAPPDLNVLRAQLGDALPAYMVPAHWMVLPELPLTANLKRDHDALRALWRSRDGAAEPEPPDAASGPGTDTEEVVRRIFGDVLHTQVTDHTAHFFAIGGDSLAVMELIERVRANTGIELDLADVIKNPTIEKLTGLLVARTSVGSA
jgi:aryl carrier-like protein